MCRIKILMMFSIHHRVFLVIQDGVQDGRQRVVELDNLRK